MREEEAVTLAVAEEEKRKAVEAVIARREARERERQAMETARLHWQQQPEEEAEARRQALARRQRRKLVFNGKLETSHCSHCCRLLRRSSLRGDEVDDHHEPIHNRRFL